MISSIRSALPGSLTSIKHAQRAYTRSVKRLSVGTAHEPDQVARSVKLEAQQREVIQRRLSQNQTQSLLQTADAALNEITPAMYRLHELALRGLNTVIGERERALIDAEARELESWINASVNSAHFNGKSLFDTDLNLQTLDEGYQLEAAIALGPLLEAQVPNEDHEIVLIFDPSRSLSNVNELFSKVVEAAQTYQLKGGDVSIGVAFAPINLQNRPGQTAGPRDMVYHEPVSVTNDPQGDNLGSLQSFLNAYDFGVGSINFGEAIQQVHDQTEWRADAAQSLVIVTTSRGEDNKTIIPDEIERFLGEDPRRRVSAIGMPNGNHTTSSYFSGLMDQYDAGYYHDYSDDLAFDEIVTIASGETRLIPEVNLSNALYAEDTMTLVEDALDKLSTARGQLGALARQSKARVDQYWGDESSLTARSERDDMSSSQHALAERVSSELDLKRAVQYQRAERVNHWRRFLDLVTAHT